MLSFLCSQSDARRRRVVPAPRVESLEDRLLLAKLDHLSGHVEAKVCAKTCLSASGFDFANTFPEGESENPDDIGDAFGQAYAEMNSEFPAGFGYPTMIGMGAFGDITFTHESDSLLFHASGTGTFQLLPDAESEHLGDGRVLDSEGFVEHQIGSLVLDLFGGSSNYTYGLYLTLRGERHVLAEGSHSFNLTNISTHPFPFQLDWEATPLIRFGEQVTVEFQIGIRGIVDTSFESTPEQQIVTGWSAGQISGVFEISNAPDVVLNDLTTTETNTIRYSTSGDYSASVPIAFYWASGPSLEDRIPSIPPAMERTLPAPNLVGGGFSEEVSWDQLTTPPSNATHLIFALDPDGSIIEGSEQNNHKSIPIASEVKLVDVTTKDFRTFDIVYSIEGAAAAPFVIRSYVSSEPDSDLPKSNSPNHLKRIGIRTNDQLAAGDYKQLRMTVAAKRKLSYQNRFIVFHLDSDQAVPENDSLYAIPLFAADGKGCWMNSGKFKAGSRVGLEGRCVGSIEGRILRGSNDFENLLKDNGIGEIWGQLEDTAGKDAKGKSYAGVFLKPEVPPYRGDDKLTQRKLHGPLQQFVDLLDQAHERGRFDIRKRSDDPVSPNKNRRCRACKLSITEAFDERGQHSDRSIHYEGRAIDFDTGKSADADGKLERLTGLAFLAGFHWVNNEGDHLHVSHRARKSELSRAEVSGALDYGFENGLITSPSAHRALTRAIQSSTDGSGLADFINDVNRKRRHLRFGFRKGTAKGTKFSALVFNACMLGHKTWGKEFSHSSCI